jgi:predicted Zn finger-like uncharacterized protein
MMTVQTTECPNCHTVFRVSDEQLQKAEGTVRCSQCSEVFNARAFLETETLPSDFTSELDSIQSDTEEPGLTSNSFAQALEEIQNETDADEILENNDIPSVLENDLIAQQTPEKNSHSVFWGFCSLILISVFVLQYAYFSREELAQDLRYRPWLVSMCEVIQCDVPYKRDIAQLHLLTRDVLIAPANNKDALVIQLSFINRAPHTQPFPVLQVYLSDAYGKAAAMRRFRPDEYLDPSIDVSKEGLDPNVPVSLTLEMVKPKVEAAAFQIDFL